jgi:hypothetical protein
MPTRRAFAGAAAVFLIATIGLSGQPAPDPHLPVPPGFDFPADQAVLLKLRDTGDMAGIRRHSWLVFAGITQSAPGGEALWETWWPAEQTFASASPQSTGRPQRRFTRPRQLTQPGVASTLAVGASDLSFVLFNAQAHKYIRDNKLFQTETLDALRAGGAADIADAPPEAMSIKTVWWPVARNQLTPLPVWDNEPTRPIETGFPQVIGNAPETWKRVVAIDAQRTSIPEGEVATVRFFDPVAADPRRAPKIARPGSRVIPLERLYHFKLTDADIARSRAALDARFNSVLGRPAQAGDFMALVCLHYTTKEIDDWVWATFWWHDRSDDGAFAAGRPTQVSGPWRNYLMDATFSMDTPAEPDVTPKIVFNPWLEAHFPNGVKSNCMTCHQRAVWPGRSFLPVTRGSLKLDDPYFNNTTRLDFLWSVRDRSH